MRPASSNSILIPSLLIYAGLAGGFSFVQTDYVCADFVAYITVAKRMIEQPWGPVTSYWAPLFSWSMIPFLLWGVDDLVAGRLVLLISGGIYLLAIHRLIRMPVYDKGNQNRLVQIGTMTCATLQASIWATYLLDPDLIANAFLYGYFCAATERETRTNLIRTSFLAGLFAGLSYLSKAYMLPFCLLHFLLTIGLRHIFGGHLESPFKVIRRMSLAMGMFWLGLVLLAGPWIAALSWKCGRPTFSTAGSANHANMSPENFRKDPLWHPGVNRDFIFEPHLTPDWSPLRDFAHVRHQIDIVIHNVLNCIGLIPIWLVLYVTCLAMMILLKINVPPEEQWYLVWVAMTVLVYCGGYTTVNLEARYIVPTVAPLLCHASLLILRTALSGNPLASGSLLSQEPPQSISTQDSASKPSRFPRRMTKNPALAVVLGVLLLSAVDIDTLVRIARKHPQSLRLEKFQVIADQLCAAGFADNSITCNDWHLGLYVSYAANRLTNYWGSPLSRSESGLIDELDANHVKVFLRFVRETDPSAYYPFINPFSDSPDWTRLLTIRDPRIAPDFVEVYVRR